MTTVPTNGQYDQGYYAGAYAAATSNYYYQQYTQHGSHLSANAQPYAYQPQQQAPQPPQEVSRVYTHNPYRSPATYPAPQQVQPTPTPYPQPYMSRGLHTRQYSMHETGSSTGSDTEHGPIHHFTPANTFNMADQFQLAVGSLVSAACSTRGRSMLLSVIRLQNPEYIAAIFAELTPHAEVVMMNPNGCHVFRTLVEHCETPHIVNLMSVMSPSLLLTLCTQSQHTRRIIQSLLEKHSGAHMQPIIDVLRENVFEVSITQQGCIAMMRGLDYATPVQKEQLVASILPHFANLALNAFGNYVAQSLLAGWPATRSNDPVFDSFSSRMVELSVNKYASNVMEKMTRIASAANRKAMVEALIFDQATLNTLMHDGFGNFVVQALIDTAPTQSEMKRIADKVRPLLHASPYGHKIEARLRNKRAGSGKGSSTSEPSTPSKALGSPTRVPAVMHNRVASSPSADSME